MTYIQDYIYIPQYEWASSNQHGDRFKRKTSKQLSVATLSCKTNVANELRDLILLSHTLGVPVHYDFEDHTAFIKLISYEAYFKGK